MIRIYNEAAIPKLLQEHMAFRPSGVGFMLVHAGSMKLTVNEEQVFFHEGALILLSGDNVYQILKASDDCRLYLVSFDRKKLRQRINFNFNGYNSYRLVQTRSTRKRFVLQIGERAFRHLLELCRQLDFYLHPENNNHFSDEIITGLSAAVGFSIANELLKNVQENTTHNHRKETITARFLELVAQHFKEEKELKFYANQLYISVKYLSNCVREVTQLPPTRFLSEAIVNEAKELLLNTHQPVYAISDELNFSDQYAFGKFFKKHTGQSPLNFRKRNQSIDTI